MYCRGPRSRNSMNSSPAISSDARTHRVQEMHRSRSSSTWLEIATGLANSRLSSRNLVSPRPLDMAWFCSGHSPPLSHIGQSSGWLISRNSITPCCALSATREVSWVLTTMPSVHTVVHEASGLRWPPISTRHCRQAPIGSSSGWSQNLGIWMPIISAARITKVPLGTAISNPSMVTLTVSVVVCTVMKSPGPGGGGGRVVGAAAFLLVLHYLVPEVLDHGHNRRGRGVTERAERPANDVLANVEQLVQVFLGTRAVLEPLDRPDHPVGALPARRALAARLVLVELGPAERDAQRARAVVENLQRPGAEQGPGGGHRLEVKRHVQVLVGQDRRGRPAGSPELQPVPCPDAAGHVEKLAQRDAERRLVLAGVGDVPGQREDAIALGLLRTEIGEPVRTVGDDRRHAGDGLHVVDHRRAGVEAFHRGERRAVPRQPAVPLKRGEQRG